jgi:transcriptional regulator with XRE-family HTH domain
MIKNQRQFSNTVKQANAFRRHIESWNHDAVPDDVHPEIYKAEFQGLLSMLETLESEIQEYKNLVDGDISCIKLNSLSDLPHGLIKSRIAQNLTQKDLAERLGLKHQQIQRWEFEDYENAGFGAMVEVASALNIDISEVIKLPEKPKAAMATLSNLGLPKTFIKKRMIPLKNQILSDCHSDTDYLIAAASRLEKIFGISIHNLSAANDDRYLIAAASARFKLPINADAEKVNTYSFYANFLASLVVKATPSIKTKQISRDWSEFKKAICGDAIPTFDAILNEAWHLGIRVLPLSDTIRFHGACWRFNGENVVVIKQSSRFNERWAFDLLHEIYHAGESPQSTSITAIEGDATSSERRESDDERAANEFAGNILLNGRASELYDEVIKRSDGNIAFYKRNTTIVANEYGVGVGYLANYVAFRLKTDVGTDWWGACINLQSDGDDPYITAKNLLLSHLDLTLLNEDDAELLTDALIE